MSQSGHRLAFLMLVTLAILARAVIPTGFMPEFDQGKIALQICHGAELTTIYLDGNGHPAKSSPAKKDCPYAPISQSDGAREPVQLSSDAIDYTQIVYGLLQATSDINYTQQLGQPRAPPIIL